jgi:hypothetical protein
MFLYDVCRYSEVLDRQHERIRQYNKTVNLKRKPSSNKTLTSIANRNRKGSSSAVPDAEEDNEAFDNENLLDKDSDGNTINFAIYFLEEAMRRAHSEGRGIFIEPSIYHTLVYLLSKYDGDDESGLLNLLRPLVIRQTGYQGEDDDHTTESLLDLDSIDLNYILRTCKQMNRHKSYIYTLILLNMYEQSVQKALVIGISFTKEILAMLHAVESGLLKKMWMSLAQHVIATADGTANTNLVLDILKESNGVLRIEVSTILYLVIQTM